MSKPISDRKRTTNRKNADQSTGPRTAEGKTIAAGNAMRHGVFAQRLILPGEDPDELRRLKCGIVRRLNPRDGLELQLVERVVIGLWKLRRLQRIERCLYTSKSARWDDNSFHRREDYGLDPRQTVPPETIWATCYPEELDRLDRLEKQEHRLENSLNRTLRQLAALRKEEQETVLSDLADDVLMQEESTEPPIEKMANEATATELATATETNAFDESIDESSSPSSNLQGESSLSLYAGRGQGRGPSDFPATSVLEEPTPQPSSAELAAGSPRVQGERGPTTPPRERREEQTPKLAHRKMSNEATETSEPHAGQPLTADQETVLKKLELLCDPLLGSPPLHELSLYRLRSAASAVAGSSDFGSANAHE